MQPCDFVLFGAHGDLAKRKLIPSLYQLDKAELFEGDMQIIGVARQDLSGDDYITQVRESLKTFMKEEIDNNVWDRFVKRQVCKGGHDRS